MLGKEMSFLGRVSELSRLEFASPQLTLKCDGATLTASSAGSFSGGARIVKDVRGVPTLHCDVDAALVQKWRGMFSDDEDVRWALTPGQITLRSKKHRLQLRTYAGSDRVGSALGDFQAVAIVDCASLSSAVELGAIVNSSNTRTSGPLGLHLNIKESGIQLLAYNGSSVFLITQVAHEGVAEPLTITAPAEDLKVGLSLFDGVGPLEILREVSGKRVLLRNDRAWFRFATVQSKWPDFAPVFKKTERVPVTITAEQLKTVATMAKALGAANYVELLGTERGAILRTTTSDTGRYETAIEAEPGALEGSVWYGSDDLLLASRLGDEVLFRIAKTRGVATLVPSKHTLLIISTKAV